MCLESELLSRVLRQTNVVHAMGVHWLIVNRDVIRLSESEWEHINTIAEEEA